MLVGYRWQVLTVAALGIVAWHYWRLRGVLLRLAARQRVEPTAAQGVWNELDRLLHRSQEEMRSRKSRLVEMLPAYSTAAAALPDAAAGLERNRPRVGSEEHTSELRSLMRTSHVALSSKTN